MTSLAGALREFGTLGDLVAQGGSDAFLEILVQRMAILWVTDIAPYISEDEPLRALGAAWTLLLSTGEVEPLRAQILSMRKKT